MLICANQLINVVQIDNSFNLNFINATLKKHRFLYGQETARTHNLKTKTFFAIILSAKKSPVTLRIDTIKNLTIIRILDELFVRQKIESLKAIK